MRVAVILNPKAGRGRGDKLQPAITATLERLAGEMAMEWTLERTLGPDDAKKLAGRLAEEGWRRIVAAGGDGTLGQVADGLVGTGCMLGYLPIGTGNDFARALQYPSSIQVEEIIRRIVESNGRRLDLGKISLPNSDRCFHFVNSVGCGLDAGVAHRVNRGYRHIKGKWAYIAALVEVLLHFSPVPMRLAVDDTVIEERLMLACISNGTSYGGGMLIAPHARWDDGLLEVILVRACGKFELLRALPSVFRGKHLSHPKVISLQVRRIRIESEDPAPLMVDGETDYITPAEIEVCPGIIQIAV